jgi:hypothetical protein
MITAENIRARAAKVRQILINAPNIACERELCVNIHYIMWSLSIWKLRTNKQDNNYLDGNTLKFESVELCDFPQGLKAVKCFTKTLTYIDDGIFKNCLASCITIRKRPLAKTKHEICRWNWLWFVFELSKKISQTWQFSVGTVFSDKVLILVP